MSEQEVPAIDMPEETLCCPQCGAELAPGAKFCAQCGMKLEG